MHVLLIHQAFAGLNEAGGTRHYEMAQYLARHGHQVTIIASPVSYLTGKSAVDRIHWVNREEPEPGITILRTYTYSALHRSFVHRVFSFFSFMFSSFWVGCSIKNVSVVLGYHSAHLSGIYRLDARTVEKGAPAFRSARPVA